MNKKLMLVVLSALITCSQVSRANISLSSYTQLYDTANTWDYAPYWITEPTSYSEALYFCSDDPNNIPEGDIIKLMTRPTGGSWSSAQVVLRADQDVNGNFTGWEGNNVCDPSVVKGSFAYNSHNYTYAMYYSGGPGASGTATAGLTSIGVAFSDDQVTWTKYSGNPIITSQYSSGYGAGQTSIYSNNGYSTISMIHTDASPSYSNTYLRTSTDGITWSSPTAISYTGLGSAIHDTTSHLPAPDIAYDYNSSTWYLAYNVGTSYIKLFQSDSSNITTCSWTEIGEVPSTVPDAVKFDVCIKKTAWGNITPELPTVTIAFGSREENASMTTSRVMAASN